MNLQYILTMVHNAPLGSPLGDAVVMVEEAVPEGGGVPVVPLDVADDLQAQDGAEERNSSED